MKYIPSYTFMKNFQTTGEASNLKKKNYILKDEVCSLIFFFDGH